MSLHHLSACRWSRSHVVLHCFVCVDRVTVWTILALAHNSNVHLQHNTVQISLTYSSITLKDTWHSCTKYFQTLVNANPQLITLVKKRNISATKIVNYFSIQYAEIKYATARWWVMIFVYRKRHEDLVHFFTMERGLVVCTDIDGLMQTLSINHNPLAWRLYIRLI